MKAARKRLGVLPRAVRWAQVGPKPCALARVAPRPAGDHEGYSAQANLPGERNAQCPGDRAKQRGQGGGATWAEHDRGGHFPAVAEPQLLAETLRYAFRPLRS
jgi:hypothetical protein